MPLIIYAQHDLEIREHGARAFPHECCGFLLGRLDGDTRRVMRVLPATNDRGEEERHNRFTITPEASFNAEKVARAEELDIVGHYHSHPNAPAKPSAYDLDHATWPGSSFAIVSVRDGEPENLTSWLLADDRSEFHEETIKIVQETP